MTYGPGGRPALDAALLSVLTSAGVAGVFCVLFVTGLVYPKPVVTDLKAEISELKRDRDAQRERADVAIAAAQGTRDILAALQAGARLGISAADRPDATGAANGT